MQNIKTINSIFQPHQWLIDAVLLGGLLGIIILVTTAYISQEKYIYFWDYANYYNQTNDLVFLLKQSPQDAFKNFLESLETDYNKVPCLLLIPNVS